MRIDKYLYIWIVISFDVFLLLFLKLNVLIKYILIICHLILLLVVLFSLNRSNFIFSSSIIFKINIQMWEEKDDVVVDKHEYL